MNEFEARGLMQRMEEGFLNSYISRELKKFNSFNHAAPSESLVWCLRTQKTRMAAPVACI